MLKSFYTILWAQIALIIKGIQFCFSAQFYKVSIIYFKKKSEYIPIRMAKIQNNVNTKYWWKCEAKWTLILCRWEYKMAQPLWKMIWKFLTRVNILLLYTVATVLFGIFPQKLKTYIHAKILYMYYYITLRAYSNSCPSCWWCHPTISSCRPLFLLPSVFPSIRVFYNESVVCIRWPKYWSFSFSISPSNECSGLISFTMDWLDLLAVQGTLKSLLQHHSSKASILQCSDFFIVQLSHPYMTAGKTIALTRQTLVGKVMSLLFNELSRLVIAFLARRKHLLISWLQSPSAVILEPPNIKSDTVSTVSPSIWHEGMELDTMIFSECWVLSQLFHSPLSISSKSSLVLLRFLP